MLGGISTSSVEASKILEETEEELQALNLHLDKVENHNDMLIKQIGGMEVRERRV